MVGFAPGRRWIGVAAALLGPGLAAAFVLAGADPARAAAWGVKDTTEATRVLPWTGGDRLGVAVDADVRYVQGPSASVVVSGPRYLIRDIVADGGWIRRPSWRWWDWWGVWRRPYNRIRIVVTAPHLSAAGLSGSGRLDLGLLSQDRLDLDVSGSGAATLAGAIRSVSLHVSGSGGARLDGLSTAKLDLGLSGSGWVVASGVCEDLHLGISGSGHADMSGLSLNAVEANLSGSGGATLAPRQSADLGISGSGVVRLLTEPQHLVIHRSGSGAVIRAGGT